MAKYDLIIRGGTVVLDSGVKRLDVAVGFKAFMSSSGIEDFPAADDYTLYRGMQIAAKLGRVVAVHAENDTITRELAAEAARRGATSAADYIASRPVVAEVEAIQRA